MTGRRTLRKVDHVMIRLHATHPYTLSHTSMWKTCTDKTRDAWLYPNP